MIGADDLPLVRLRKGATEQAVRVGYGVGAGNVSIFFGFR